MVCRVGRVAGGLAVGLGRRQQVAWLRHQQHGALLLSSSASSPKQSSSSALDEEGSSAASLKAAQVAVNRRILASASGAEVFAVVNSARPDELSDVNLSTAMQRLARLPSNEHVLAIVDKARQSMDKGWSARCLSSAAFAAVRLLEGAELRDFVEAAVQAAGSQQLDKWSLTTLTWCCAKIESGDNAVVKQARSSPRRFLERLSPVQLATMIWSLAKLDKLKGRVRKDLSRECARQINDMDGRSLSNVAWAFAHAPQREQGQKELFRVVAVRVAAFLAEGGRMAPQSLSNLSWAFAKAGVETDYLQLANAMQIDEASAQSLANTVWALATTGTEAPEFFNAVAKRAPVIIHHFNPQELANTAWAFRKGAVREEEPKQDAGFSFSSFFSFFEEEEKDAVATEGHQRRRRTAYPELLHVIGKAAQARMGEFDPPALALLAGALRQSGVTDPFVYEAIADHARARIDEFKPHGLAQIAGCYLDGHSETLLRAVARRARATLDHEQQPEDLGYLAYVFSRVGASTIEAAGAADFHAALTTAVRRHNPSAFTQRDLRHLDRANVNISSHTRAAPPPPPEEPVSSSREKN